MKAHELRKGDEYREDDKLIYTLISDPYPVIGSDTEMYVEVRYAGDWGVNDRAFNREQEVKHVRPE